jgi:tetratricopeptide (TPR) repeat protein
MRKTCVALGALCAAMLAGGAFGQSTASMPGLEHHHHDDAPAPGERLGHVSFATSCAAASQSAMERGVALLHSFGYSEAQMQFATIAKSDPTCAMAHWGIAMAQYHELWEQPGQEAIKLGAEEMAKARSLSAPPAAITPREKAYIAALSAFFDPTDATFQQRADAYEAGMNALHREFPDDVEGAAFDALAILAATPATDTSLTHPHQALAILVPLFAAHPDHPGLAHYIIHTCDTPALAPEGLAAARVYAKIAPSSPHALHMPGHIFARLGMWPEDIDSNLASVAASKRAEAAGEPGAAHQMHADEFLIYAYLQVGEDEKARVLTARIRGIGERMNAMPGMDDMKEAGPFFDNELSAIYPMEMHQWKTAATLTPAPGSPAYEVMDTYWAQGVAAGHLRDAKLAAAALTSFDQSVKALKSSSYVNFAPGIDVKRDEIVGWKAFAETQPEAAVVAMRKAADQQDKLGQEEVDIPAREMLGDLLLLEHKPAEALTEYRVALKESPNRLNGLLSAGDSAEQAGLAEEARTFYKAAAQQTDFGKYSQRPELLRAVKMAGTPTTGGQPTVARSASR